MTINEQAKGNDKNKLKERNMDDIRILNGFELSDEGLSIIHGLDGQELKISPTLTLGFGRIMCSYNGSSWTYTISPFVNAVRDSDKVPNVTRISEGIYRVYYPSDWVNIGLVQSRIIATAIGYYDSSNHNTTVTIQQITETYVQFVVGDDMSPNDNYGFWFCVEYMLP